MKKFNLIIITILFSFSLVSAETLRERFLNKIEKAAERVDQKKQAVCARNEKILEKSGEQNKKFVEAKAQYEKVLYSLLRMQTKAPEGKKLAISKLISEYKLKWTSLENAQNNISNFYLQNKNSDCTETVLETRLQNKELKALTDKLNLEIRIWNKFFKQDLRNKINSL